MTVSSGSCIVCIMTKTERIAAADFFSGLSFGLRNPKLKISAFANQAFAMGQNVAESYGETPIGFDPGISADDLQDSAFPEIDLLSEYELF